MDSERLSRIGSGKLARTGRLGLSPSRGENNLAIGRIDLIKGKTASYRRAIGYIAYQAMVDVLKAPPAEHFPIKLSHSGRTSRCLCVP
jgi:hypothetical protein